MCLVGRAWVFHLDICLETCIIFLKSFLID
ncbi:unnamed protein product [Spirodela intermedia]|uniref:Uncharacterized protein n=2 Tax=Spirodela intermedia TaxID=51605 RepID=A0A7I8KTL9_SPIIN|nr:unnamed protein product [Spirodela intermedia]CAA7400666.1 unnamed protein product [Spirodela intermedia]